MSDSYPCPCCGHGLPPAMPGSYEICPVCLWEDDGVQFRRPTTAGGANKLSLTETQRDDQRFGACDQHGLRPPTWIGRTDLCPEENHQSDLLSDCARFTRPA
ncbi:CPCC family cysteine-rich protein [Streptomyces wuyuanensis]|uniref:CPCC family cysteine-rich protein n=1 Tax=Streptomyces wuyuanensis TaxID=1196353 RepID=UPI00379C5026